MLPNLSLGFMSYLGIIFGGIRIFSEQRKRWSWGTSSWPTCCPTTSSHPTNIQQLFKLREPPDYLFQFVCCLLKRFDLLNLDCTKLYQSCLLVYEPFLILICICDIKLLLKLLFLYGWINTLVCLQFCNTFTLKLNAVQKSVCFKQWNFLLVKEVKPMQKPLTTSRGRRFSAGFSAV